MGIIIRLNQRGQMIKGEVLSHNFLTTPNPNTYHSHQNISPEIIGWTSKPSVEDVHNDLRCFFDTYFPGQTNEFECAFQKALIDM